MITAVLLGSVALTAAAGAAAAADPLASIDAATLAHYVKGLDPRLPPWVRVAPGPRRVTPALVEGEPADCDAALPDAPVRAAIRVLDAEALPNAARGSKILAEEAALDDEHDAAGLRRLFDAVRDQPAACSRAAHRALDALHYLARADKSEVAETAVQRLRLAYDEEFYPSSAFSAWSKIADAANVGGDRQRFAEAIAALQRLLPAALLENAEDLDAPFPRDYGSDGGDALLDYAEMEIQALLDEGDNAAALATMRGFFDDIVAGRVPRADVLMGQELAVVVFARSGDLDAARTLADTCYKTWKQTLQPKQFALKQLKMAELFLRYGDPARGLREAEASWAVISKQKAAEARDRQWAATILAWARRVNGQTGPALAAARESAKLLPPGDEQLAKADGNRFIWRFHSVTSPWQTLVSSAYATGHAAKK